VNDRPPEPDCPDPPAVDADARPPAVDARHVLRVRVGSGANCSSIGSVVDTLFVTAALGAGLFAGVVAALRSEPVRVAGPPRGRRSEPTAALPPAGEAPPPPTRPA
jgi:hypothetical protein